MIMDNRFLVARRRYDPDTTRYINAVQLADGQALEPEVAMAVDSLVKGLKDSGIWDAIKASCLLCGPRTLAGALVPLVGTAPTEHNLTNFDYNRVTGLKGDGATTYLDSGRAENADGQNDAHMSVYVSTAAGSGQRNFIGAQFSWIAEDDTATYFRRNQASSASTATHAATGFLGVSREDSASIDYRINGATDSFSQASVAPSTGNIVVYRNYLGVQYNDARLAFYSIGSAIPNLAALDSRISTYVAAIAAAL